MNLTSLLKNYDRDLHLKYNKNISQRKFKLQYVFSEKWEDETNIPYVAKTHLLDSYYCLPERPDMAFTFLWKSINNLYAELYTLNNPEKRIQDGGAVELAAKRFSENIDLKIRNDISLKNIFNLYIKKMPEKITSFIANYILKSCAIKSKFSDNKNISTSYETFANNFKEIYKIIEKTYGESYSELTDPKLLENGSFDLKKVFNTIEEEKNNEKKIHGIIRSLSEKIKKLMINGAVTITHKNKSYDLNFNKNGHHNNDMYINFIIKNTIYAIRNNTFHGKIASRLNSKEINNKSYFSSSYTYLLGYFFMSVLLYELDYIEKKDLGVVIDNYDANFHYRTLLITPLEKF